MGFMQLVVSNNFQLINEILISDKNFNAVQQKSYKN